MITHAFKCIVGKLKRTVYRIQAAENKFLVQQETITETFHLECEENFMQLCRPKTMASQSSRSGLDTSVLNFYARNPVRDESLCAYVNHLKHVQYLCPLSRRPERGLAIDENVMSLMKHLCHQVGAKEAVEFLALEIYDRYVMTFAQLAVSSANSATLKYNIESSLILVLLCCLQIASKMAGRKGFVLLSDSSKMASSLHSHYTVAEFQQTEYAVLNAAGNLQGCVTPVEFVEAILPLLRLRTEDFNRLYGFTMKSIAFSYMEWSKIFKDFHDEMLQKYVMTLGNEFELQTDYCFRAVALIYAAMVLIISPQSATQYLPVLQNVSQYENNHIVCLAEVFIRHANS